MKNSPGYKKIIFVSRQSIIVLSRYLSSKLRMLLIQPSFTVKPVFLLMDWRHYIRLGFWFCNFWYSTLNSKWDILRSFICPSTPETPLVFCAKRNHLLQKNTPHFLFSTQLHTYLRTFLLYVNEDFSSPLSNKKLKLHWSWEEAVKLVFQDGPAGVLKWPNRPWNKGLWFKVADWGPMCSSDLFHNSTDMTANKLFLEKK